MISSWFRRQPQNPDFSILVIISIFVSNAIWDPTVPRRDNFIFVQFGQWGLYALSIGAFWLVGTSSKTNMAARLTFAFLLLGGG
jgi:hypothetical protein